MNLQTNIHLVTKTGLDDLFALNVEGYKLPDNVRISEIGKRMFAETGHVNLFIDGNLLFIPVANDRNQTLLVDLLKKELHAKSFESKKFSLNYAHWPHVATRVLYFSVKSSIQEVAPDAQFEKDNVVTFDAFDQNEYRNGVRMRFIRVDEFGFALSFDLVRIAPDSDEYLSNELPPNPNQRKTLTDKIVDKFIPETGLRIHLGGKNFVIPRLPISFEMEG